MYLTRNESLVALLALEMVLAKGLLAGKEYRNERRAIMRLIDKLQQR